MNLLIVESPSKINAVEAYANASALDSYKVIATVGHLVDLPVNRMGIDTKTFHVEQEIIAGKEKQVRLIKKAAKKANQIILAGDADREGEGICVQVAELLDQPLGEVTRIRFHEITKRAIKVALENPGTIDINLYNAQQARRIIDRLLGYTVSPIISDALNHRGLSAGRVQSVVLGIICKRTTEIKEYVPTVGVKLFGHFEGEVKGKINKKITWDIANRLVNQASQKDSRFLAGQLKCAKVIRNPGLPFTTSTLQQGAQVAYKYGVKQTMQLAQKLYQAGLVTYIRTDKAVISSDFIPTIHAYIKQTYGDEYIGHRVPKAKKSAVNAQEAHEAIRPTNISNIGEEITNLQQKKLYQLIWRRTVASCMSPALFDSFKLRINVSTWDSRYWLEASAEVLTFPGYTILNEKNETEVSCVLDKLEAGSELTLVNLKAEESFSDPPPAYTEASLVNAMEKQGIGRPSTYASNIGILFTRYYVETSDIPSEDKEIKTLTLSKTRRITTATKTQKWGGQKKRIVPTSLGEQTNTFICEYFSNVINEQFTAEMEKHLDKVALGQTKWRDCVSIFYQELQAIRVPEEFKKRKQSKFSDATKVGVYRKADVHLIDSRYGKCLMVKNKKARFVGIPPAYKGKEDELSWDQIKFLLGYPYKLPNGGLLKSGMHGRYIEYSDKKKVSVGEETFSLTDKVLQ